MVVKPGKSSIELKTEGPPLAPAVAWLAAAIAGKTMSSPFCGILPLSQLPAKDQYGSSQVPGIGDTGVGAGGAVLLTSAPVQMAVANSVRSSRRSISSRALRGRRLRRPAGAVDTPKCC